MLKEGRTPSDTSIGCVGCSVRFRNYFDATQDTQSFLMDAEIGMRAYRSDPLSTADLAVRYYPEHLVRQRAAQQE